MTVQTAEIIRHHFSDLELEFRNLILATPVYVRNEELEGYLDLTLGQYFIELYDRMIVCAKKEDLEQALAIKRFINARLKDYADTILV